ncbi:MAG: sialate O-acetylesterase [Bacteroidota bacterium]
MRIYLTCIWTAVLLFAITFQAMARVKLPAIFNDGMVLQQKASVPVWGKAESGQRVTVRGSWSEKKYSVVADANGNWKVSVKTPGAGGPFELYVNDGTELVIKDVLIGEVWLCSGQSNMNMSLNGYSKQPVHNADSIASHADYPTIRYYRISSAMSRTPEDDCPAKWSRVDPSAVRSFSAVAYQFATLLDKQLHVPIGIIQTAYGGTTVEAWMDSVTLSKVADIPALKAKYLDTMDKKAPYLVFNAMIHPIIGYGIKGALWYQGESNKDRPEVYATWFTEMVKSWRKFWGQGNFPFYYAQISPYKYNGKHQSAYLREAQVQSLDLIPNSGMVITLDIGSNEFIHPPDKTTVAERFSYWALSKQYDVPGLAIMGPVYKKMKKDGNTIRLVFDHTGTGLTSFGKELKNFEIAGEDKVFYPASAIISGKNEIVVKSDSVAHPVAVRYGFKDWVVGDLFNIEGLPASSFRTDAW